MEREFNVLEYNDKSDELEADERFGYRSVHYLAKLRDSRAQLLEYKRFAGLVVEIQARTILQHAWAEIEHDVQYKARTALPAEVRRRFMSLAGMLEVADREFEAIQALNTDLRTHALESVARGDLGDVELTPEALQAYLDKRYGPDGRMKPWSYSWTVRLLRSVDLDTVAELDELIDGYDDDTISRLLFGSRQGQLTRLEHVVLAALGEKFIDAHPWNSEEGSWFGPRYRDHLQTLLANGINPRSESVAATNTADQAG